MATFTRVNGAEFTDVGTLYSTSQIDAYKLTIRSTSNGDNTAVDLRSDDGTVEGSVEQLMREISPLMYYADDASTGVVHVIVDNHANTADSLTSRIGQIFGTDSTAELGGQIAVTAGTPVQTGDS
jgi:hypothetical protein